MSAEPPTSRAKIAGVFRKWRRPNDDWICFLADVHQPNQFWRITAFVLHRLVRNGCQAAPEQRLHGMSPGRIRRRELQAADKARGKALGASRSNLSQTRNIQNDLPAIHITHVGTVLTIRVNFHGMRPITIIDGMPLWQTVRQALVVFLRSREPPPAHLVWVLGIAKVHHKVELIVFRIRRIGIPGSTRKMSE